MPSIPWGWQSLPNWIIERLIKKMMYEFDGYDENPKML